MTNATGFQVNQHKAFENVIVKHQVYEVIRRFRLDMILRTDKSESFSQLQQERLQVRKQRFFQLTFQISGIGWQIQEFEYIWALDEFILVGLKFRCFLRHLQCNRFFELRGTEPLIIKRCDIPVKGTDTPSLLGAFS